MFHSLLSLFKLKTQRVTYTAPNLIFGFESISQHEKRERVNSGKSVSSSIQGLLSPLC